MKTIVWISQAFCLLGLVGLSGCASTIPALTVSTRVGTSQNQATIEVLHSGLQERERTIAIQHDQTDQPPVVRPPFKFLHADTLSGPLS